MREACGAIEMRVAKVIIRTRGPKSPTPHPKPNQRKLATTVLAVTGAKICNELPSLR